ncbi:MAG TPA: thioredoxin family protein [Thermoanaerobaculia bacterium]|nr:thioredoxin family protein [Thermoanaerobaculia bacterium]
MNVKVLGMGCTTCRLLKEKVERALSEMGSEATVEEVKDFPSILAYGVSSTPALVVDGKVVLAGRVPEAGQLRRLLTRTGP